MRRLWTQSANGYKKLFHFHEYTTSEIVLKSFLLVLAASVYSILFLLCISLYVVERLVAPLFKLFIMITLTIMKKRFACGLWQRRALVILTTFSTLVFAPFVVLYFAAMLLKISCKIGMRLIILRLDFAKKMSSEDILIFDDKPHSAASDFSEACKDIRQTSSIGNVIEAYFDQAEAERVCDEKEDEDIYA